MGYKAPRTYTISGGHQSVLSPVDATTYYMGGTKGSITTSATNCKILIPISGRIRSASVQIFAVTVAGTDEPWTISLFDGTTTTDIAAVAVAAAQRNWINNNMDYLVTQGSYVQFKMTTPTWVTNPEGCTVQYHLIVEYE